MKRLSITELIGVLGGRNEFECKKVQALANAYFKDDPGDEAWEVWADDYEKYC